MLAPANAGLGQLLPRLGPVHQSLPSCAVVVPAQTLYTHPSLLEVPEWELVLPLARAGGSEAARVNSL